MVKAPTLEDEYFQKDILFGVSRTFALTIPQLPPILERAVGNAYLLCRIQDTIEDDPDLSLEIKSDLSRQFVQVIASDGDAQLFSEVLSKELVSERHPEMNSSLSSQLIKSRELLTTLSLNRKMLSPSVSLKWPKA